MPEDPKTNNTPQENSRQPRGEAAKLQGRQTVPVPEHPVFHELEKQYRSIIEHSPDLISVCTHGKIRFVNPVGVALLGARHPGQVLGQALDRFLEPEEAQGFLSGLDVLIEAHVPVPFTELVIHRLDGSLIRVEMSANPITFQDQPAALVLARDITLRKKAEADLRESRKRYRELVENISDVIWETDPHSILTYINPRVEAVLGYQPEEILGRVGFSLMPPEEARRIEAEYVQMAVIPKPFGIKSVTFLNKAGRPVTLEINGTPFFDQNQTFLGYRGVARDVTEKVRAQNQIRFQSQLLDNVRESILAANLDGEITYWSKGAATLYGYSEEEALGQDLMLLAPVETRSQIRTCFREVLARGCWTGEQEKLKKNRERFIADSAISVVFDHKGEPSGIIALDRDITLKKQSETLLRNKSQELAKRVKELHCLFEISKLIENQNADLEELIQGILAIIPRACRYPNHTRARILMDGASIETGDFIENGQGHRSPVLVSGKTWGHLEVFCRHDANPGGQEMFLIEEKRLFQEITERLGRIIEKKQAHLALLESEEKARIVLNATTDAVVMLDRNCRVLSINETFAARVGLPAEKILGARLLDFMPEALAQSRMRHLVKVFETGQTARFEDDWEGRYLENTLYPVRDATDQVTMVASYSRDVTTQVWAKKELNAYQDRLRALATELSLAEENERRQIAQDLHDSVGQMLAVAQIRLTRLLALASEDGFKSELQHIIELVETTAAETRSLTCQIYPPSLDVFGLEVALDEFGDKLGQDHRLDVKFQADPSEKPLHPDDRVVIFRLVRELMLNVVKHAHADQLAVDVRRMDDFLVVDVEDNGIGLDLAEISAPTSHRKLGLVSIRERLKYLGGSLQIQSVKGLGTRVTLKVPLVRPETDLASLT